MKPTTTAAPRSSSASKPAPSTKPVVAPKPAAPSLAERVARSAVSSGVRQVQGRDEMSLGRGQSLRARAARTLDGLSAKGPAAVRADVVDPGKPVSLVIDGKAVGDFPSIAEAQKLVAKQWKDTGVAPTVSLDLHGATLTGVTSWKTPANLSISNGTINAGTDNWGFVFAPDKTGVAQSSLTMDGVNFKGGYQGGLNIAMSIDGHPASEADFTLGNAVPKVNLANCHFSDMPAPQCLGAVMAVGAKDVHISGCTFERIGVVSNAHGIYLKKSNATVENSHFFDIAGDAIRARNQTTVTVTNCDGHRVGDHALVGEYHGDKEKPSTINLDKKSSIDSLSTRPVTHPNVAKALEAKLRKLGCWPNKTPSYPGPAMDEAQMINRVKLIAAVKTWQAKHGLPADGLVTPAILKKLGIPPAPAAARVFFTPGGKA